MALGGTAVDWNRGEKVQTLTVGSRQFVIIKDLSELRAEESAEILERMAADVVEANPPRVYLVAANHGQLLEKLKAAPQTERLVSMTPHHFRDRDMREVDIVLERDGGMIVGIEVKASATVKAGDFAGLRALAEACGDRFAFGVVLYDSTDVVPFGDRLAAAPLSCLWG
jgi:Domain of unknown function (DUF4143)